jgi:hypothetical protein
MLAQIHRSWSDQPDVVSDHIGEEVGGESLAEVRVAGRPGRLERHEALDLAQVVSSKRLRGDIDRLVTPGPAPAAGEIEERLDQALQLITARQHVLSDRAQRRRVRVRIGERYLDQRALKGDRPAELVRDLGGKPFPIIKLWRVFGRTARRPRAAVRTGAAEAVRDRGGGTGEEFTAR